MDRVPHPPTLRSKPNSAGVITRAPQRGSALLAALCFATVLVVAIGSYVTLCHRTLELSTRTFLDSQSLDLAEAGMEDALWALNRSDWSGWSIAGTTASKSTSGFDFVGGVTGQISLQIANYDGSSGTRTITATGTLVRPGGETIARTLTATATRAPLFVNAVASTAGTVRFTSASTSAVVDSYDSANGPYSTGGYSAVIAAQSASTASATVQLTNAQVKGYVATLSTGPSYSTSATLKGPATPGTTKIDPARITTSPYQPVFDIRTITGTGSTLVTPDSVSTINIGTAGATTPSIYYSNGINMTGSAKIIVQGPVRIVVAGAFYVGLNGGTPSIEVKSSGTLEMFVSGDIAIYGNGIDNQSRLPQRVAIYGTNSLTVPDMNTPTDFHGVIYTPSGDFKVWSNNAIHGAIVARNVTFSGTAPMVHYDVNLRREAFAGVDTPFAVSAWREVTGGG